MSTGVTIAAVVAVIVMGALAFYVEYGGRDETEDEDGKDGSDKDKKPEK